MMGMQNNGMQMGYGNNMQQGNFQGQADYNMGNSGMGNNYGGNVMGQMGSNYNAMNPQGQHMPTQAHTQPQPAQVQKPMTQGPQSQRQMAPNVQADATPSSSQSKPATKRFAIVDPKTNK